MAEGIEFNPNSFDATMSRVEARLDQGDQVMIELSATTKELTRAIACLPCARHEDDLKELKEEKKRGRGFRDEVKLVVLSCVVTAILSVGTTLLIVH